MYKKDLSGQTYGRLKVVEYAGKSGAYSMWRCQCLCGSAVVVRGTSLTNGHTKSCGCWHRKRVSVANTKHGLYKSRLYRIYNHMIGRCYDLSESGYENYGGRGIRVCDEWRRDFRVFADWATNNEYNDDLTLDRINVNEDYKPDNCRWITRKAQANNMRSNHLLEFNGETHTMSEWADLLGVPYSLINARIFRGWDIERALTTPVKESYRRNKATPVAI